MARDRPTDIQVLLRVYELVREQGGPADEWDVEMALLDAWINDFELAIDHADSDEQAYTARQGIEAVLALKRAISAHVAAPGAEDGDGA